MNVPNKLLTTSVQAGDFKGERKGRDVSNFKQKKPKVNYNSSEEHLDSSCGCLSVLNKSLVVII